MAKAPEIKSDCQKKENPRKLIPGFLASIIARTIMQNIDRMQH